MPNLSSVIIVLLLVLVPVLVHLLDLVLVLIHVPVLVIILVIDILVLVFILHPLILILHLFILVWFVLSNLRHDSYVLTVQSWGGNPTWAVSEDFANISIWKISSTLEDIS